MTNHATLRAPFDPSPPAAGERVNANASGSWSSAEVRPQERTEAWRNALADNFFPWLIDKAVSPDFSAELRHRDLGDVRIAECRCDPCDGDRTRTLIEHDDRRSLIVQIAKQGVQHMEIDGSTIPVSQGDMLLCTSDRPVTFTVTERIHKVSLILPWSEVSERLPERRNFKSAVVSGKGGIGAVLFSHVASLGAQMDTLRREDIGPVRRATIELLVAALSQRVDTPPRALAQSYLDRLQAYVLENLHDENLSPASIAEANRMSVRYVHLLFADLDLSVSSWIRLQRLERCREALSSAAQKNESVSQIAYRWGFRDPLHFSRLFKRHYGVSPTRYRVTHADG